MAEGETVRAGQWGSIRVFWSGSDLRAETTARTAYAIGKTEAMSTAEELEATIAQLRDDRRPPMHGVWRETGEEVESSRWHLSLAAWAVEIADVLQAQFGPALELSVGALQFPDRTFRNPNASVAKRRVPERLPQLDPVEVEIRFAPALVVRSGFDAISALAVTNRGTQELSIRTNGNLIARVVEPTKGAVVGGYVGVQAAPLVIFHVPPGETAAAAVPLLVGTTSYVPELGYAVPPGQWLIETEVDLGEKGRYVTPRFPIAIVP